MSDPRSGCAGPLAVAAVVVVVAVAFASAGWSGAAPPSRRAVADPALTTSRAQTATSTLPPLVEFLTGEAGLVGGSGYYFPLNFTVPANASEEFYFWSIGAGLGDYQLPTLPSGMSVVANTTSTGVAMGSLAPGTYTTSLYYPGWTNDLSIGVYALMFAPNATFQYGSTNLTNPAPGTADASLDLPLPSGGLEYLGVAGTGGYALASWSLTTVAESAPAWEMVGATQVIGNQSSSVIAASSAAGNLAISGVGIYTTAPAPTGPSPVLLDTAGAGVVGFNQTVLLNFTVPAGLTHILYAWAIGGGRAAYGAPTLPSGMTVAASIGTAGIAFGSLQPGTYSTSLFYGGWTNEVSVAVFGILNGANTSYVFGASPVQDPYAGSGVNDTASLELPAGAAFYLGVATTGGYPVSAVSMAETDVYAPAYGVPGTTQDIGLQLNPALWEQSGASSLGIVGVGIYTNVTNVTFVESGLPTGAPWQLALNGVTLTVTTSSVTVPELPGNVSYLLSGPSGYRVQGRAPGGVLVAAGSSVVETVSFVRGKTATLTVRESELPRFIPWCFTLYGRQVCSTSPSASLANLTPGSYAVTPESWPGVPFQIAYAHKRVTPPLSLTVAGSRTLAVTYQYPYAVTFVETGLGAGTWTVKVDGVSGNASAGQPIVLYIPNGKYAYHVSKIEGYRILGSPARLVVDAGPTSVQVYFAAKA